MCRGTLMRRVVRVTLNITHVLHVTPIFVHATVLILVLVENTKLLTLSLLAIKGALDMFRHKRIQRANPASDFGDPNELILQTHLDNGCLLNNMPDSWENRAEKSSCLN